VYKLGKHIFTSYRVKAHSTSYRAQTHSIYRPARDGDTKKENGRERTEP
jgi:hypothetical protein